MVAGSLARAEHDARADPFQAAFDRALDAMAIVDDAQTIEAVNDAAAELLGAPAVELAGRSFVDYFAGRAEAEATWARLLAGESSTADWTIVRADGTRLDVELTARANVAPGRHLATMRDVTERRALRVSERRLQAVSDSLDEGLVLVRLDGVLEWANGRFFELVGYEPDELLGRDIVSLLLAGDERVSTRERLSQRRTGVNERYEVRVVRKNGTELIVQVTATPVRDDQGRPIASVGTVVDLSEERRRDAERRELEAELEQAQTLASLGRLAGGIAHDFNNVITVVAGNAELLRAQQGASGTRELEQILIAVEHAQRLTQRLLALAGKRRLATERLSLNEVIREFEPMVRTAAGDGVELHLDLGSVAGAVLAERTQLEQIILNLVLNARDAMGGRGRLTIATGAAGEGPAAGAYLRVEDNGVGMDEDTIRHAFEPFFTTKESAGSGLGLAVVYGAVQQLGGRVWIESAPGEGATFHVVLPGAHLPPEPTGAREPPRRECSETILVADDNEGVRSFIRRVLVGAGYRVVEAASGPDAERTIRSGDPPIDLLLADVVMPGLDGFELGEAVRDLNGRIRIVHMSGYAPRGMPERPELRSVFLAKPFTPDVLLDRVRQALDATP